MIDIRPVGIKRTLTRDVVNDIITHVPTRFTGGSGVTVKKIGLQVIIEGNQSNGGGAATNVISVAVYATSYDYITGYVYNPVSQTEGAAISIAKPYELRRTPFHGNTVTYPNGDILTYTYATSDSAEYKRSVTDGTYTEYQYITAMYWSSTGAVDCIIQCIQAVTGVTDGSGNACRYVDLNTAGRAWAG